MSKKEIKKPLKQKTYSFSSVAYTKQMQTDNAFNWIIAEGVSSLLSGKTPGKSMMTFLEHVNIIKEDKE